MNQIHIDKLAEKLEGALLERGDLSHEDCMQAGRALYDLVEENEIIV